jgi:hypothetical protein
LIQNAIKEQKTKNILLSNTDTIEKLDDSSIDIIGEKLFSEVIKFPILSTSTREKKSGKWVKKSSDLYEFYLSSTEAVIFSLENEKFICKSEEQICKEIE